MQRNAVSQSPGKSILLLLFALGPATWGQCRAEGLPSIFSGDDLAGWKVPEGNLWWSAGENVLKVRSDPGKTGSILWTEAEYRNFVMEFEFKFIPGDIDSGIFLRNENDQIQIGISGSLKRDMTGSPYIADQGKYPVEAEGVRDLLKLNDWNKMTIVAKGSDYTVWLNGSHVVTYRSTTASEKGPVGIQLHPGRQMAIDFRAIKLAELE